MKVSVIQFNPVWSEVRHNLDLLTPLIQQLQSKTDLVVLPEMFCTGFNMKPEEQLIIDQEIVPGWMQSLASSCNFAITGTVMARSNGILYNRMYFVSPDKSLLFYDKKHLFGYGGEKDYFASGNERVVWKYKGWKIKPVICYDIRFPVWMRNDSDYDLILCSANWPERRIQHWNKLLQARAIENLSYTIGANRVGAEPTGITYTGESVFINFSGELLKSMNAQELICTCELNKDELLEYRNQFRFLDDRDKFEVND